MPPFCPSQGHTDMDSAGPFRHPGATGKAVVVWAREARAALSTEAAGQSARPYLSLHSVSVRGLRKNPSPVLRK